MNVASPIPPKIRTILPSLGSSVDGEALAAARGLGRTLAAAGLDFHDLAAAIPIKVSVPDTNPERGMHCATAETHRPAAAREPHEYTGYRWREAWAQHHRPRAYTPRQDAQHRAQAAYCRDHDRGRLNWRERNFVWNIANLRSGLTYAQGDWLASICDRLEFEDRGA